MIGMCRIERIDWEPPLDWFNSTVDDYLEKLRTQIAEDWHYLVDILNTNEIKFPSPDGIRYIVQEGAIAPRFTFDFRRVPWSLNGLLNERNHEGIHLTDASIVGYVMDHMARYSHLGFEGSCGAYFDNATDANDNAITPVRLVELGIVLFKRLWDNCPLELTSSLHNIGFCVAYVHRLVLSGAYDAYVRGEQAVLRYLSERRPDLNIHRVQDPIIDTDLKVDLEIVLDEYHRIGIQVKPSSNNDVINSSEYTVLFHGQVIRASYSGYGEDNLTQKRRLLSEIDEEVSRLRNLIDSSTS